MILHDVATERELIRIASPITGKNGFETADVRWWTGLFNKLTSFGFPILMVCLFLGANQEQPPPQLLRQILCSLIMMLVIRAGMSRFAATSQKCGLFSTLVNLPIPGQSAFSYVRKRFFRSFWFVVLSYSLLIAFGWHHFGFHPLIILNTALLFAISFASISLFGLSWFARSGILKIWYAAGAAIIACSLFLNFRDGFEAPAFESLEGWIDRLLWIFPPAWVFPGKAESGGLVLAFIWISLGIWNWVRWPSKASRGYDRPNDFFSAFGGFIQNKAVRNEQESHPLETIEIGPPMSIFSSGWVNRLVVRSIHPHDRVVAGAILNPSKKWSKSTNISLLLAPLWLSCCWLGRDYMAKYDIAISIRIAQWLIPLAYALLTLFPHGALVKRATNPYPLGAAHVPFFCTLPISIRCVLRISQRVALVRTIIFTLIATPFFWALALINGQSDVAAGLLSGIPAFAAFWVVSRPMLIWHHLQATLKRKRGIFILHCATASVVAILFVLWIVSGFLCIAAAYLSAIESNGLLLIFAALGGLILSAVFSKTMLEILINEVRHRRYDWVCKTPS